MGDYTSRQYLLDEYDRYHQGPPGGARKIIAEAPAADVTPVVHEHWIDTDNYYRRWKCSACSGHTKEARPPFCPFCGAKMDA